MNEKEDRQQATVGAACMQTETCRSSPDKGWQTLVERSRSQNWFCLSVREGPIPLRDPCARLRSLGAGWSGRDEIFRSCKIRGLDVSLPSELG